ncbi:hypothetical protein NQ315_004578 [Exocentrus adspersus]|uniref:Laminin subunit gamma-1 n=1 Tax=Exocentrus adspersus TaxID=1586481 RepID=A0AAV8VMZ8_9CUCU|nr:hypothetical protein NQ315_004578 [Exocentrus adspersus]
MNIFIKTFIIVITINYSSSQETSALGTKGTKCYDNFRRPQRCIPEFENAAFNLLMEATNTCGENGPIEYCVQTGVTGIRKSCEVCYPNQHHARYLTDVIQPDNPTWWQSETMREGIQWPNQVNLTLRFGKAFDITYVRLLFFSPRPESFFISKKTTKDGPWIPYQFYSATCRDTYGLPDMTTTTRGEETRALCTSEYSDISPLKGGNVAFGTLEGRPSAYNFDTSPELHEWVTATEIRITLDRLNTFGDEVFGDEQVLRSYFYAIADVAVGARCKCNGHASECITSTGEGISRRVCKCEHNTAGPDCNECLPFYNDAPWHRATARNAHECKQCNCNGFSNKCYFDEKLYEQTGHGGHCIDCTANRDGPNCEHCRENYYMREDGYCIACDCNPTGSHSLQCNREGKCQCKPGITGDKCDHCAVNHYDFTSQGCNSCECLDRGSAYNEPNCDAYTGVCHCKENVEGKQCSECKPGFFNLDFDNDFGCTPCFCYGHSSECNSALGFSKYFLESSFAKSSERWSAEDEYGRPIKVKYEGVGQNIAAQSLGQESVYFLAPDRFLGDQRASYNQLLEFSLTISDNRPSPTATDIILEGSGATVTNTIFAQQNKLPTIENQVYKFRLHEHPNYGWQPRLSARAFISILTNLTAIKIRGTYSPQGVGYLDDVKLETALRGVAGEPALWVESCNCPTGYVGQFCESCAPGFRHSPALGGPFKPCIPCDCNNHASICDSETGRCICQHNTAGENCEFCARGYYGNALGGTPSDCLPCGCPNGGPCIQVDEDIIMCTECPVGYTGHRCDSCSDGYFGDPTGQFGPMSPCEICACNSNIDSNGIGNCNSTTGECLKCIYNTGGPDCGVCLPGYYGNALVLPKGDCKPCQCYHVGTVGYDFGAPICDQSTGACSCKSHVVGRNCDHCEEGYYNLQSGEGCHSCNCDPIGSYNQSCNSNTGQCYCRPGVTGLRCDHCEARKYGFSTEGCKDCLCDSIGSKDLQCDASGQCPCLDNVEGRRCDRCKENKYDRQRGCIDCPDCYNLVQNAARSHNNKLNRLNEILDEIERHPTVISDDKFPEELSKVTGDIEDFYQIVKNATGEYSIVQKVFDIQKRGKDVSRTLSEVDENVYVINDKNYQVEINIDHIDNLLEEAEVKLSDIETAINTQLKTSLENAWKRSQVVGQQSEKMTKIAQEARELVDGLDDKAETLVAKSKEAKNKSIDAYEIAKNANAKQSQINEEARQIRHDLLNTEVKLNKTRDWTRDVSNRSIAAKNNALNLLNEVKNLDVTQIDIPKLKKQSADLQKEAHRLENKTRDLYHNSENLRKAVTEKNEYGKQLMQKAYEQQYETDDLLNEIHQTKESVDNAINSWNKILNETENIYKDLKDFDTETQKSKQEAEEALRTINEIEAIIVDTLRKTYEAQQTLTEATTNADSALQNAIHADNLAKNASQGAKKIKMEAELLLQNTTDLIDQAGDMQDKVTETEDKLEDLLQLTGTNISLINEAKDKVGRAGKDTDETSKVIMELLKDVDRIMTEIKNSPDLSDDELNKLEEELMTAEKVLKDAKLEEKLVDLQNEHQTQADLIDQYKLDISRLQKEVQNIEEIVRALPDGCFRKVELEP